MVDDVRKLDIPINARVSVFAYVIYPVLNSTTMSFICKWAPVDNLSFSVVSTLVSFTFISDFIKDCLLLCIVMSFCFV